jgi:hypothetical protein
MRQGDTMSGRTRNVLGFLGVLALALVGIGIVPLLVGGVAAILIYSGGVPDHPGPALVLAITGAAAIACGIVIDRAVRQRLDQPVRGFDVVVGDHAPADDRRGSTRRG